MKEYKYIDLQEELLNNDSYCDKCKDLLKEISNLEEANDELRSEISYLVAEGKGSYKNIDLENEIEELREMCDEKSFLINELLNDIESLEKRNENLLNAFLTVTKILNEYMEN